MRTAFNPKRPTGTTPEALFDQWVWDLLQRKFANSPTVTVNDLGRTISFDASPGSEQSKAHLYQITELLNDSALFVAMRFNNDTKAQSGAPVYIAKCLIAQPIASETIAGQFFTYQTLDDSHRKATAEFSPEDIEAEFQVLLPRYEVGNLIVAMRVVEPLGVKDPNNSPVQLLEMSPCRHWASQYLQVEESP